MTKQLIVGRVVDLDDGRKGIVPLDTQITTHGVQVLEHQKKTAALIAAAYLYRDNPSLETLHALKQAAHNL